ncbi:hypothetical protein LP316_02550 [Thalassotalea sp. LPB0316]|uniref:hypothetical protein n=1 Tax=Thalassotalea sp. LPB0316 TaxID=2769490 RepID=UPI001866C569|nr:hypothetical protein [Thalassotalea sp. LPB0316]QOL26202.1 hypothetical protein LP316_02550 [Thalassotalea sp. LPB0316]
MTFRSRSRRQKPYQIKKTTIRDDFIDKQILAIHKAMAKKVLAKPELIEQVKATLEQKREDGRMGYGAYLTWFSLLDIAPNDPDAFYQGVIEYDKRMRKLRRNTPFVNILTEDERQKAIELDATGSLDDYNFML